jgi:hypothetical protein
MEPNTGDDSGDVVSTPDAASNSGTVSIPDAASNPGTVPLAVVPNTLAIYRNLRIGLSLTAVMLSASILIQSIQVHAHDSTRRICFQSQLSEYFYTTAHSVFIGSLLILAALFFVYRGTTDTENALLQIAGVAALTAALVPEDKQYLREKCKPPYIPENVDIATVIRINLVAVVVALTVAWLITLFQNKYNRHDAYGNEIRPKKSPGGNKARCVLRTVVVLGLVAICIPNAPLQLAHGVAGLLLLSSFIATVFVTSFVAGREICPSGRKAWVHCFYRWFYLWWAIFMVLTLIGIVLILICPPKFMREVGGTILEAAITVEFCVYWVVQTFDLWDRSDRRHRLSVPDRYRLQQEPVPHRLEADDDHGAKVMKFL